MPPQHQKGLCTQDGSLQLSGSTAQVEAAQQLLTERVHFQQFEVPRDAARAILGNSDRKDRVMKRAWFEGLQTCSEQIESDKSLIPCNF